MKVASNVMYVLGFMFFIVSLHGCTNVTHSNPKLHDGRWGDYNGAMTEQCALQAMVEGIDSAEITKLFNQCVFEQGLTI